jgi:hypothetical protein
MCRIECWARLSCLNGHSSEVSEYEVEPRSRGMKREDAVIAANHWQRDPAYCLLTTMFPAHVVFNVSQDGVLGSHVASGWSHKRGFGRMAYYYVVAGRQGKCCAPFPSKQVVFSVVYQTGSHTSRLSG